MPSLECAWSCERRPCRARFVYARFQEYRVSTPAKGLLVFSEVHYPEGWQLTIDGVAR